MSQTLATGRISRSEANELGNGSMSSLASQPVSSRPRRSCGLCAEMTFFCTANSQHPVNRTASGVRVRSKIVPSPVVGHA